MVGQSGLDQNLPSFGAAARPARDLTQELEATLGRTEIGQIDSNVRVDDPNEGDIRKVEALGDHLGSEQDVHLAGGDAIKYASVRPFAAGGVDIHAGNSRRWKSLHQQTLHLLGAQSALLEIPSTAARAIRSRIFLVKTVVADQPLGIAVMRESYAAMRTGRDRSAIDALDERGVAATIEEKDALLTARHRLDNCIVQGLAYYGAVIDTALRHGGVINGCLAQINDVYARQFAAANAIGQRQQRVFAGHRVRPGLERRRGAAKDRDGTLCFGPNYRHLSRVIPRCFTLLVAGLVLFVDDDGAEILEWSEDSRSGSDDDPLVASFEREPGVVAFTLTQRRVKDSDPVAKGGAEAIDGLRGECYLGDQNDGGLASLVDDPPQQLDVDEGLTAAGYSVQQENGARVRVRHLVDGVLLDLRRHQPRQRDSAALGERISLDFLFLERDQPPLLQGFQDGRGKIELLIEVLDRGSAALRLDHLEHRALLFGAREGLVALQQRGNVGADLHNSPGLPRRRRSVGSG